MMNKIIFIYIILVSNAMGKLNPSTPDCNATENVTDVREKLARLKSNDKIKTVQDFICDMPLNLRQNFVFIGDSRSAQKASKENPRVMLASPDGDVRLTFNLDPSHNGYDRVEMSIWNPEKMAFDFEEVVFPQDAAKMVSVKAAEAKGNRPEHDKNPKNCVNCHGAEAKSNWDNYNFWAGSIPFNKDTLVKNSQESKWYLDLIKRVEADSPTPERRDTPPRWQNSKTVNRYTDRNTYRPATPAKSRLGCLDLNSNNSDLNRSSKFIEAQLEDNEFFTLPTVAQNGTVSNDNVLSALSLKLFDKLVRRRGCQFAQKLSDDPKLKNLKYLIAGNLNGCELFKTPGFLPNSVKTSMMDYFKSPLTQYKKFNGSSKPAEDIETLKKQLTADSDYRQKLTVAEKLLRQQNFLAKNINANSEKEQKILADKELELNWKAIGLNNAGTAAGRGFRPQSLIDSPNDLSQVRTFGEAPERVAILRMIFEPFGIDASTFSTNMDSSSYAFSDYISFFEKKLNEIPEIREATKLDCKTLGKLSYEAFEKEGQPTPFGNQAVENMQKMCIESLPYLTLPGLENGPAIVDDQVDTVFRSNCTGCHVERANGKARDGAPVIDFTPGKLRERIYLEEKNINNIGSKVWNRITTHSDVKGMMPLKEDKLSAEEITLINKWLKTNGAPITSQ